MILKTRRLVLRELTEMDFPALCTVLMDAQVTRAYEHAFSETDVWDWLHRQQRRYREEGFGLWAVCLRETGELIGNVGLTHQPCEGEMVLEVGYLLADSHRGKGYAKEAAEGCIQYGFTVLGAPKVCSVIAAANTPSLRVAQSLGMEVEREFITEYFGVKRPHILYAQYRHPEKKRDAPSGSAP